MELSRKHSEARGMNNLQKMQQVRSLLELINLGSHFNVVDVLFGWLLASAALTTQSRVAKDLKRQFDLIQNLFFQKILGAQTIVLVVVDALNQKRRMPGSRQQQKNSKMLNTLQYNVEESMTNHNFISQKWAYQKRMEDETMMNQQALKRLLDEEMRQSRKKAQEAESAGWECPVCISEIDRNNFGILECGHIFHPECINGYLKMKIESNQVDMCCPMEGCNMKMTANDIFAFVDGALREKYEKFTFNKFVQSSEGTSWCPTAGCPAVFAAEEGLDNYRCLVCHEHYCLSCRCKYHHGMTCAQYRINNSFDKNDQAFIDFVKGAKFKQCPKCNYWVERNQGCSTMACKCGQQFCYDCGGTGCPHGSCSNSGRAGEVVPAPPGGGLFGLFRGGRRGGGRR